MSPISVMLVDDNATFLGILASFLREHYQNAVVVVGTAQGTEEAMARARALRPQVILLDLAMPDITGLKAIPRLRNLLPEVGIVALSLLDPSSYRQAALEAGADEFVFKGTLTTDLLPAIRRVAQAGTVRHAPVAVRSARDGLE